MSKRTLTGWLFVFLFFFILSSPPPAISYKKEDTARLSFKKTAVSKEKPDTYIVKKDEWIFDIIRKKFGGSDKKILKILEQIKRLNPEIKDLHRICPGQKLLLPGTEIPLKTDLTSAKTFQKPVALKKNQELTSSLKKESASRYVVKEGESLSDIIQNELKASHDDIYQILWTVKRLNPNIENINRIYPEQKLLLPLVKRDVAPIVVDERAGKREATPIVVNEHAGKKVIENEKVIKMEVVKEEKVTRKKKVVKKERVIAPEKQIAVIRYILSRVNGSIISKGNYYIPLLPSGQITIDCSVVPVVEFDNGMTILLDMFGCLPEELKKVIELTWENYAVINVAKDRKLPSVLEKLINASGDYSFKEIGNYVKIGDHPAISVFTDWIVSEKVSKDKKPYSFGIKRIEHRSALLPGNVRRYADENGFEIIELLNESGVEGIRNTYESLDVPSLNSNTNAVLAESLLRTLGYSPLSNSEVEIYNMKEHGFKLSMKVDLLLKINDMQIIIHSRKIPQQFTDVLKKRGTDVVFISEGEKKEKVFEKVLHAIGTTFLRDKFSFSFSRWNGKNGGEIFISAIRIKGKHGLLYFVDQEINKGIYGLLHKKWGVNLVKY